MLYLFSLCIDVTIYLTDNVPQWLLIHRPFLKMFLVSSGKNGNALNLGCSAEARLSAAFSTSNVYLLLSVNGFFQISNKQAISEAFLGGL